MIQSECELITLDSSSTTRGGVCDNVSNNNNNSRSSCSRVVSGVTVVTGRRGPLCGGLGGGGGSASWLAAALLLLTTLLLQTPAPADAEIISPVSTLECHRRQYTYKVHKTDDSGRNCWDFINMMSCWGRCDSNEIADWKFPFKRSHHPVCMHKATKLTEVQLRNCDEDADPGTEMYTFHEATECACALCKSNEASCEGLRVRGARRAPSRRSPKPSRRLPKNNRGY